MPVIEHTIDIDELVPVIEDDLIQGIQLYGKAILTQSDPEGEDTCFYVKKVILDGDYVLVPDNPNSNHRTFKGMLFTAVAEQIESDKTAIGKFAQAEFNGAVEEANQPDPDQAYEEMRDRRMEEKCA